MYSLLCSAFFLKKRRKKNQETNAHLCADGYWWGRQRINYLEFNAFSSWPIKFDKRFCTNWYELCVLSTSSVWRTSTWIFLNQMNHYRCQLWLLWFCRLAYGLVIWLALESFMLFVLQKSEPMPSYQSKFAHCDWHYCLSASSSALPERNSHTIEKTKKIVEYLTSHTKCWHAWKFRFL